MCGLLHYCVFLAEPGVLGAGGLLNYLDAACCFVCGRPPVQFSFKTLGASICIHNLK